MDTILDYLDMLDELMENSKTAPFSNKASIDREQVFDIISEMRMNLPHEIRQAQRIINEREKIIQDAKNKAGSIIKEAESLAQELAAEHEVHKIASEKARGIMEETAKNARTMKLDTIDYVDDILSKTEETIRDSLNKLGQHHRSIEDEFTQTIEIIYSNRQEIRGNAK